MSDALNKNVPVYPAIYCEDEQGNPDSTTAMYPWHHVRAAGPNVLKDTTLCGTTTVKGLIDGCARPIWSAVEVSLVSPNPFAETSNQSPNSYHQINADSTQSFQVNVRNSYDNINAGYPLIFTGSSPQIRSIAVENQSGKDLLVRGTLDISFKNSTDPNQEITFVYATTQTTFSELTTPFYPRPGAFSFSSIFTVPAGERVQPLWATPSATNNMEWSSIKCLFEIVGCDPQTTTNLITVTGSGPGGGG